MRGPLVVLLVLSIPAISAAQGVKGTTPPQPGTVRVAVINIGVVFNKYDRAIAFKKNLASTLEPYKEKAKKLTDEMKDWKKRIDTGKLSENAEDELKASITKNQRQLEDMEKEIKRNLSRTQEENLTALWNDVNSAIDAYATAHGIELVLGYGDPIEKELVNAFPNVNRKMQAMDTGSTVPLFFAKRVEIAEGVSELLNRRYREMKAKEAKGVDFE